MLDPEDKDELLQLLAELAALAQGHAATVYKSIDIMPEDRDRLYHKYTQITFRALEQRKRVKQYKVGEQ